MLLLLISFVAGVLTILAPCTLPLLPVIIGSSVDDGVKSGGKKKAFIIALSLSLSVILFTLLLKASTLFIFIPQLFWSYFSGTIIIIFGLISIFPTLWESLPFVSRLSIGSNKLLSTGYAKQNIWGDVIIGASLGPVFSSCSPTYFLILATVLPQSFFMGLIDLIAYSIGLSIMLFLVSVLGQKVVNRLGYVSDTHGWFKRSLGFVFVFVGIVIILGLDKQIQIKILDSGFFDITKVEQIILRSIDDNKKENYTVSTTNPSTQTEFLESKEVKKEQTLPVKQTIQKTRGPKAPELVNPSGFINTEGKPIKISDFRGKVVLLDIWTYSCINCQRTLPYVKQWYEKYKDKGLVIIGVHTPEFAFERVQANVEDAVKKFGLTYPVVLDNEYATWTAYGNRYWPRKYLINDIGEIVYDHIGEGNYDETEMAIIKALSEAGETTIAPNINKPENVIAVDPTKVKSPEIYFGANRNERFGNGLSGKVGSQTLQAPSVLLPNLFYLDGIWNFSSEYVASKTSGKILFKYSAKNVYMVASSDVGVNITVYIDGKKGKTIFIKANQLYTLVEGSDYSDHLLEIQAPDGGLNAFTFTFG